MNYYHEKILREYFKETSHYCRENEVTNSEYSKEESQKPVEQEMAFASGFYGFEQASRPIRTHEVSRKKSPPGSSHKKERKNRAIATYF